MATPAKCWRSPKRSTIRRSWVGPFCKTGSTVSCKLSVRTSARRAKSPRIPLFSDRTWLRATRKVSRLILKTSEAMSRRLSFIRGFDHLRCDLGPNDERHKRTHVHFVEIAVQQANYNAFVGYGIELLYGACFHDRPPGSIISSFCGFALAATVRPQY